jgi:Zn-dependent M28 family amino/carboxypeptidase
MIRLRYASAALLVLAALAASATDSFADEVAFLRSWESIRGDALGKHVEELASDAYLGRAPGTEGETKTLAYVQDAFEEAGAKPGAPGGGWLQDVPLVEVRPVAGSQRFSMKGPRGKDTFEIAKEVVVRNGRPSTGATLSGLPLVFAGYGITAPEEKWDDYAGADVAGAAVILIRAEPADSSDSTLFQGKALTTHGMPQAKSKNAGRHGAKVAIVVHTDASAGHPWSLIAGGGMGSQIVLADDANESKVDAVVHISEPAIRRLLSRLGQNFDSLSAAARRRGFRAKRLAGSVDVSFAATTRTLTSHNVIAKVEGKIAPDEAVVYTGHWDHVGTRPSSAGPDSIFNGAIDNATGTSGVLEIARAFASLREPVRRTVYFVATTSEEKGLLGSEYLSRHPVVPLSKIAAVINLDALFPYGTYRMMVVPGFGSSEIEDVLAQAARRVDRVLVGDDQPEQGAFYRSDHYPFAEKGVPAVFAVGNPTPEAMAADTTMQNHFTNYMQNGYHHVGDEYDAKIWDMRGIEEDVRVLFETGYRIADDSRFPNWRWGSEFRAKRDAMMNAAGARGAAGASASGGRAAGG